MNQLFHYIQSTDSTINHLQRLLKEKPDIEDCYSVYTFYQTAGRGQAGNSWESEEGKNLLFSTLLRPKELPATDQFSISMLISLTVVNAIETLMKNSNSMLKQPISIKWPNDIYAGDKKLVGILIENTLSNRFVNTSIAGVGINVNQTIFLSNAPNPISLKLLTGQNYDLHLFFSLVQEELHKLLPLLYDPMYLKSLYMNRLYRSSGLYPYIECEVSAAPIGIQQTRHKQQFLAQIYDIDSSGRLCLRHEDGTIHCYHFKQVRFVIE